jgi:hypothetical protein
MNLPWAHLLAEKDGMFLQTGHQKPLIDGHVTRRTPVDPAKLILLEQTLDPVLLDREGVDVLILHKQWAKEGERERLFTLARPFYEDERIMAVEVSAASGAARFRAVYAPEFRVEDRRSAYFFAPGAGWFDLSVDLTADERDFRLLFDDGLIWQTHKDGPTTLPIFVTRPGYHTLEFLVEPSCPAQSIAVLTCRAAVVTSLSLGDFEPGILPDPVLFEHGISLSSYAVKANGGSIMVDLSWTFESARQEDEIRFVHAVDQRGVLVAQSDESLGQGPAGSGWMERTVFADLGPGTFELYTGWYTYPDFRRFAILTDVADAPNGWVHLGQVQLD